MQRIVASKKVDIVSVEKLSRMINADTLRHSNIREIGSEWICHNTWDKLQLTQLLLMQGFSEDEANLAATQVISRAVYPASEMNDPGASCRGIEYKMQPTHKYKQPPRSKLRGILSIKNYKVDKGKLCRMRAYRV